MYLNEWAGLLRFVILEWTKRISIMFSSSLKRFCSLSTASKRGKPSISNNFINALCFLTLSAFILPHVTRINRILPAHHKSSQKLTSQNIRLLSSSTRSNSIIGKSIGEGGSGFTCPKCGTAIQGSPSILCKSHHPAQ